MFALSACKKDDGIDYLARDKKIIEDYIASKGYTASSTPEGLYYMIVDSGNHQHPNLSSQVKVHYKGYLTNDSVFDQTDGTAAQFYLYGVIKGWQIGIPLFGKGGKGKLFIPSDLGYGDQSYEKIPSRSVLIFDIVLSDFQ
jgi:FKBP-type peptidyl-prolyl cis-trans isomerase